MNRDKIDDATLALFHLVTWTHESGQTKVFKGFDWETLARLHRKGYIANPKTKNKAIEITPEGIERSKALFKEYFED